MNTQYKIFALSFNAVNKYGTTQKQQKPKHRTNSFGLWTGKSSQQVNSEQGKTSWQNETKG